jgi:hypothetical protein
MEHSVLRGERYTSCLIIRIERKHERNGEDIMHKKIMTPVLLVAILFVSAIAVTIICYNRVVSDRNSTPSPTPVPTPPPSPTPLIAPTYSPTNNSPNENLTFINFNGSNGLQVEGWDMTFTLQNTGNAIAIINNIIIDGQSYSSINPVPTINPSIKNGYALSPNQTVTITIHGTPPQPFHKGGKLYVVTAIGNSYLFYLIVGL